MLLDPLVPRDFAGWFGRVATLFRSEFGPLTLLAVVPAVLTAGYLVALNAVRQSPEEVQSRLAAVAAPSPTPTVGARGRLQRCIRPNATDHDRLHGVGARGRSAVRGGRRLIQTCRCSIVSMSIGPRREVLWVAQARRRFRRP